MSAALERVGSWPAVLVLSVAALLLVLESGVVLGVLLPGSTTLVFLGLWSAVSDTHPALPIAVAAPASIGGALFGWQQGHRRRGTGARPGRLRARIEPTVRWARDWLTTQGPGGSAVVLAVAQWAAVSRTLTPRVAGGAGVPLRLVAPVLLVSGTAWACTVVLLARELGERVATDAGLAPVLVLLAVLAGLLLRARLTRSRPVTGS